jgi:hypothetical protein
MRHLFITFRPRFTTTGPPSVITDGRRYTGVTTTGYVIIVIAAVAIVTPCTPWSARSALPPPIAFASGYDSRSSPDSTTTGKDARNILTLARSPLIEASRKVN